MWSRAELKNRAKAVMKRSYWMMFAVALVAVVLCGELFQARENFTSVSDATNGVFATDTSVLENYAAFFIPIFAVLSTLVLVGAILGIFYSLFIAYPIQVGKCRYFIRNADEKAEFSLLFSVFGTHYFNVVKIMLIKNIKLFLWTMLFIIPGIIKMYEYQMIPYILAEDPGMDMDEVFRRSKQLTSNQKLNMFVLDLSFIGWNFLGALLFGIGNIFVNPYKEGVGAELYIELKQSQYNS